MQHIRPLKSGGNHALGIHGGGNGFCPGGLINPADFAVARLLQGVAPVLPQQLGHQIVEKIGACPDDNLGRVHLHSPKIRKMPGDGLPQLQAALAGQGAQQRMAVGLQHLPLAAAPHGEGKLGRHIGGQIQQRHLRGFRHCGQGNGRGAHLHRLHKIAHLFPGGNVALGGKPVVGTFHGDFAQPQMGRQRPLGGQTAAPGQPST